MGRWRFIGQLWSALGVAMCILLGLAAPAYAQPPATNPNEMCGNGDTFTVTLPGLTRDEMGIDDVSGVFRSIEVPAVATADTLTLPKGCRIYAFLISGFGDNDGYDHIAFYKVAEFVAQNNGYVHVGWWNNLAKEYMERPLHNDPIILRRFIGEDLVIFPTPKTEGIPDAFFNTLLDLPKANPDDDYQFLADAKRVLQAVRTENRDALIIVVGHSMGGNAVARLGAMSDVPIDLLAPIDPVGNRDTPRDESESVKFNWTRWRATHDFKGWKQRDCIRQGIFCQDFDPGFFSFSARCRTVGPWLPDPPLIGSLAPVQCPGAHEDPGPRLTIGANVRHLYHRWQTEFLWPVDYNATERFNRPTGFTLSTTNILSPNYQAPVLENVNIVTPDPSRTCAVGIDPRDSTFLCNPTEGHGELIGVRTNILGFRVKPGLALTNWPARGSTFTPGQRRARLIQLAEQGEDWPYRPANPDLCLVCDDIIAITQHLMAQQPEEEEEDTVAPVSHAVSSPDANAQGWFNEDVVVSVNATDTGGSGVQSIQVTLSGATTDSTTTPGVSAMTTLTAEGVTTVSYFARDVAGNHEPSQTLDIRIDKTAPELLAVTDVTPNANGWIAGPAVVSFPASDEPGGSGLAATSPDVPVATEAAGLEISGSAEDNAGNTSSAVVTLNIDLTPPGISLDSRAPAANGAGWNNTPVTLTWTCSDALSGPIDPTVASSITGQGAGQSRTGVCADLAGNTAGDTQGDINIDLTTPGVSLITPAPGIIYLLNAAVPAAFACTDTLSGVASCAGTVANGALLDTSAPGPTSFVVTAADAAANTSTVAHPYSVRYSFTGFMMPIRAGVNVVNGGRTVPVKFSLLDANGASISSLAAIVSLTSVPASCETGEGLDLPDDTDSSGQTTLRYDAGASHFIYNWKTEKTWAGSCRHLTLTLADGGEQIARFRFQ